MDFMLEEELIDLYTFCLQNPDSPDIEQKKIRIKEIGKELFADGGVDALENFFFAITNRIEGEINKSPAPFRSLWNGLSDEWKYWLEIIISVFRMQVLIQQVVFSSHKLFLLMYVSFQFHMDN